MLTGFDLLFARIFDIKSRQCAESVFFINAFICELKRIINFLKTHLKEINIFLDIGSHKGTYTDLILKNILVTEKLILIEPQKNIFDFIQNKYKNDRSINIYNHAISNKEKKMKLKSIN